MAKLYQECFSIEFPPSLQLEERLLGGEPHVVHALGVGDAEARALPARQQQDRHLALRDGRERQTLVLGLLLKQPVRVKHFNGTVYRVSKQVLDLG